MKDFDHLRDGADIAILTVKGSIEGFTAAWLAHRVLVKQAGLKVRWYALEPELPFPNIREELKGAHIRIIGAGMSKGIFQSIGREARSIILYDTDLKTRNALAGIRNVKVDFRRSATRQFWAEIKPALQLQFVIEKKKVVKYFESAPWIVDFSETQSAWLWKHLDRKLITAAVNSFKQDFDVWDGLCMREISDMVRLGKEVLEQSKEIKKETKNDRRASGVRTKSTRGKKGPRSAPDNDAVDINAGSDNQPLS